LTQLLPSAARHPTVVGERRSSRSCCGRGSRPAHISVNCSTDMGIPGRSAYASFDVAAVRDCQTVMPDLTGRRKTAQVIPGGCPPERGQRAAMIHGRHVTRGAHECSQRRRWFFPIGLCRGDEHRAVARHGRPVEGSTGCRTRPGGYQTAARLRLELPGQEFTVLHMKWMVLPALAAAAGFAATRCADDSPGNGGTPDGSLELSRATSRGSAPTTRQRPRRASSIVATPTARPPRPARRCGRDADADATRRRRRRGLDVRMPARAT